MIDNDFNSNDNNKDTDIKWRMECKKVLSADNPTRVFSMESMKYTVGSHATMNLRILRAFPWKNPRGSRNETLFLLWGGGGVIKKFENIVIVPKII